MKQLLITFLYFAPFACFWLNDFSLDNMASGGVVNIPTNESVLPCSPACDPADSLVLVGFYTQTISGSCPEFSPPGWTIPWFLNNPVCSWNGITLNSSGKVIGIDLQSNGLTGNIPPVLAQLDQLEELILSNNCLTGNIPPELGSYNNLIKLFLDGNELVGSIPEELCMLSTLQVMFLDENTLTGTIPECFNDLDQLGQLDVFDNCLDSIPDLSGMFALQPTKFRVQNNKFTFDDILPNLPKIVTFYNPQDSFCTELNIQLDVGSTYALDLGIDDGLTTNSYQWYKDGLPFGAPTNSNTLIFSPVAFTDAGTYHCQVTNPAAPLLTLQSRAKIITVICAPSTYDFTPDVCDGYEVTINGTTYNQSNPSGSTTLPGQSQFGCDSIINVALNFVANNPSLLDSTLCATESIVVNGNTYDINNPSGTETFGNTDMFNCDSMVQINLSFFPAAVLDTQLMVCLDETVTIAGEDFNFQDSTGQVILSDASFLGCDSIINVDLDFFVEAASTLTGNYCAGQEVIINGTTYDVNNPSGTETIDNGSWRGCDSIIVVDLSFGAGVTFNLNATICEGQGIDVNGQTYDCNNPTGTEVITGGSYLGCDSTIIVSLNCYEPAHGILDTTLCQGEELEYNGTTYDNSNTSGIENLGGIGFNGCDSLVDVTVQFFIPAFSTLNTTLCSGESITVGGQEVSISGAIVLPDASFRGCDSTIYVTIVSLPNATHLEDGMICPGSSITVNGTIYDENNLQGTEVISGGAANGCDSIITIDLSLGTAVVVQNNYSLCPGDSLIIGTVVLDETNTLHEDTIVGGSFSGCDSITITSISYYDEATSQHAPSLCMGESIVIGGVTFDANHLSENIVLDNASYYGCDSILMVNASLINVETGSYTATLCTGESIVLNGTTYDESNPNGMETIPMGSYQGCDSSFVVNLTFTPSTDTIISEVLCSGGSLSVAGMLLDENNPTDTITLTNVNNCDSTIYAAVSFYPEADSLIAYTLCFGQEITVNGNTYDQNTPSGTELIPGGSIQGCDSTIFINLSFNNAVEVAINQTFCDPTETVIVNSVVYNIDMPSGVETMTSYTGCDSIVTVSLSYPDTVFVLHNSVLCPDEMITVNGTIYNIDNPSGEEVEPGASPDGCDVFHTIDLSFYPIAQSNYISTLCFGESITINGVLFDVNHTMDTFLFENAAYTGCDSTEIVSIVFYPELITEIDSSLCEGQFIMINGTTYNEAMPSGVETMTASTGCDSTIVIQLHYDGAVMSNYTQSLCMGDSIVINGTVYHTGHTMGTDTFPEGSVSGCDSIVHIAIEFTTPSLLEIDTMLCIGEILVVNNQTYDEMLLMGTETIEGGSYTGCDSMISVSIGYFAPAINSSDTILCFGDTLMMDGVAYPPPVSTVNDTLWGASFTGCDSIIQWSIIYLPKAEHILDTILCSEETLTLHGISFTQSNPTGEVVLLGGSFMGCDSTIRVSIFYPNTEGEESMSLCQGDTLLWNGELLTTGGMYEAELPGQSYHGCDSTVLLDLTVVSLVSADAGADGILCGEETFSLSGNLPSGASGTWQLLWGVAEIDNPTAPQSLVSNVATDTVYLSWTLSTGTCLDYDSDTLMLASMPIPDAMDDIDTADFDVLEMSINILDNDFYENIESHFYNLIDVPTGLNDLGDGVLNYLATEDLLGSLVSFQYELCNEDCPEVCDTAWVYLQLQREIQLEFPNAITPNGDGVNDVFVVPDIVDHPEQFGKQELIVVNRWGDMVYTAKPYLNDWNGTNQAGKDLPPGTYYYVLRLDVGEGIIYRGDITILR